MLYFFFQAEDGIRDLVRSRGRGEVYKGQLLAGVGDEAGGGGEEPEPQHLGFGLDQVTVQGDPVSYTHLTLPTIYSV